MDPSLAYQALLTAVATRGGADDWYRLGGFLHENGRWGAAAAACARSLQIDGGNFRALTNYGWNLHLSGRSEEGRDALLRAVDTAPTEGMPRALLSQVLGTLGDGEGALEQGRFAVEMDPRSPVNHVAWSFALMAAGVWKTGFLEYEHRFALEIPEFLQRPYRLWRGEQVETLYLESEQGSGDSIMALRWLPEAASRAKNVIWYVHGNLYSLVKTAFDLPANVVVKPLPQPLPEAEAWSPMMSLPAALEWEGPRDERPYLGVAREGPFSVRLPPKSLRVGIVWAGSPTHKQTQHRDCPLAYWFPLTEVAGVELHSLQIGEAQRQMNDLGAHGLIIDRSPELTNFLDTAKVIAGLDLVITVDTSVAHLAGAMGHPCWTLVNQRGADFRWGRQGETTGWYPSMRLMRRSLDEDWVAVMRRVAVALRERVAESGVKVAA